MRYLTTKKTHFSPTFTHLKVIFSFAFNGKLTLIVRTPSHVRIQVNFNIPSKSHILLIRFFTEENLKFRCLEFLLTCRHHAWDLDYISIINIRFEMVNSASLTESVSTLFGTNKFRWLILLITDVTKFQVALIDYVTFTVLVFLVCLPYHICNHLIYCLDFVIEVRLLCKDVLSLKF